VLGFTVWHCLTIALGFFNETWWLPVMILTVLVGIGLFWLELAQLWREAKPSAILMRTTEGIGYIPAQAPRTVPSERDVIVIAERPPTV
jgi:hypothetical protein